MRTLDKQQIDKKRVLRKSVQRKIRTFKQRVPKPGFLDFFRKYGADRRPVGIKTKNLLGPGKYSCYRAAGIKGLASVITAPFKAFFELFSLKGGAVYALLFLLLSLGVGFIGGAVFYYGLPFYSRDYSSLEYLFSDTSSAAAASISADRSAEHSAEHSAEQSAYHSAEQSAYHSAEHSSFDEDYRSDSITVGNKNTHEPENKQSGLGGPEIDLYDRLLAYATPDSYGKGAGDFSLPKDAILNGISTTKYEVKRGDTLSHIAREFSLDVGTLISFNNISDVRRIWAGSILRIPEIDGVPYTVKKGDSLNAIASTHGVSLNRLLDANDLQSEVIKEGQQLFIPGAQISEYDYRKATGTLFIYPTRGRLTSPFGYRNDPFTGTRRMHYGVDLANRVGTDIVASMAGTVVTIGNRPYGYGRYVVIRHNYGYQTLYAHLHRISVRTGQQIRQGQKIGEMGNTGLSTGPHLHFSIYRNNVPVNPLSYLYQ